MQTDSPPLPEAAGRDRLAHERNAWLCTVRQDGAPHVTPVWFVLLRGGRWTGADGGSVKVRNIETLSRVSLMLEDGVLPVVAEGEATLHRGSFPQEVTDAFTTKYGWDVAAPHRPGGDRVLLHVPVLRRLPAGAVGERASARLGGPDTTGSGLPASENRADPTVVGG